MSCVLLVVALFCIECAMPAVFIAFPYLLVFTARYRGGFCLRHPEAVVVVQGIACNGVKRNRLLVAA